MFAVWLRDLSPWMPYLLAVLACGGAAATAFLPELQTAPPPWRPNANAYGPPLRLRRLGLWGGTAGVILAVIFVVPAVVGRINHQHDQVLRAEAQRHAQEIASLSSRHRAELERQQAEAAMALSGVQARLRDEAAEHQARIDALNEAMREQTPLRADRYYYDNDEACLDRLAAFDTDFTRAPDFEGPRGCLVVNAVRVGRVGQARLSRPVTMTCRMAELLAQFERDVLQPTARDVFDRPVTAMQHMGTYACRSMRGRSDRLSEHAFGNAIDLAAFTLGDNEETVILTDHWAADDERGTFLRRLAEGACTVFKQSLSPDYDALHRDHFHFDAGLHGVCR